MLPLFDINHEAAALTIGHSYANTLDITNIRASTERQYYRIYHGCEYLSRTMQILRNYVAIDAMIIGHLRVHLSIARLGMVINKTKPLTQ